jgi:precorrin-6Y C5,15-methyltransferase (decarboxylating)
MRALALSALAPRPTELLWDIGSGSGSVSVEWALAGGRAIAIERRADRAANIRANAETFGLAHRIEVIEGAVPAALPDDRPPAAVFIGGGLDAHLVDALSNMVPAGTRLVAHAVTLESESLLSSLQTRLGGELMRIEVAHVEPLGSMRSWRASRPVVQWSACL